MAVGTIIIQKIEAKNDDNQNMGFYEISSNDFDINNFYMRIDKSTKIICFFLTKNFSQNPIRIINYNKNDQMGVIPGIPTMVFSIVLRHALRVFKMNTFPESLSYAA